jgi:hypothetical protein
VRLRRAQIAVGLIGTVLTLGTPLDITLQEMRVEMFMPADEASEATVAKLAGPDCGFEDRACKWAEGPVRGALQGRQPVT